MAGGSCRGNSGWRIGDERQHRAPHRTCSLVLLAGAVLLLLQPLHAAADLSPLRHACLAFAPTAGRLSSLWPRTSRLHETQGASAAACARPVLHAAGVQTARSRLQQWRMSHALSKEQAQRNKELNEQRKQQNLAIAARVAAGELRPVVVSFSPTMRSQLRLAKRYKHTRIFVETHEVQSLDALRRALVREIPRPFAELPPETYQVAVRPTAPDGAPEEEASQEDGAEGSWICGEPLTTDESLRCAYDASQVCQKSPAKSPVTVKRD
jgi:hypothetical protein